MATQPITAILVRLALAAFLAPSATSQYATSSASRLYTGRARLFVADNTAANPAVVVVDLPSYNVTQRIQVPGTALQIGVSVNSSHLGVFRNRDNNHQFFSVLSTGVVPIVPAAGTPLPLPAALKNGQMGTMQPAVISKNVILVNGTDAMGGVEGGGRLVYHQDWKLYLMYAENHGRIFAYTGNDLNSAAAFKPNATFRLPVGHFHVLPYGNFIVAPHTGANKAYILNRTGGIVREYACTACHGAATYINSSRSMTAVFGCNGTVLVVRNTTTNGIYLPAFPPRVGSFVDGVPGVFWSSSSSQNFFWRTDVRSSTPTIRRNVSHAGGIVRMASMPSRGRFVAVHSSGWLVLYDGDSGQALANVLLREGGFPANQTAPFLQSDAPDTHVFVSVPASGIVHVVDVDHGGHDGHDHAPGEEEEDVEEPKLTLNRTLAVGGVPTAMALAYMPGVTAY